MIGFLDGPQGIYNGEYCIVDDKLMDCYRNSGGFDMIGSGRHKIEKPEEFKAAMENCIALNLDGSSHHRELKTIFSLSYLFIFIISQSLLWRYFKQYTVQYTNRLLLWLS